MSVLDDLLTRPRFGEGLQNYSCYWAALRDARLTTLRDLDTGYPAHPDHSRSWLGSAGYLAWLDLVGTAFTRTDQPAPSSITAIEKGIERFAPHVDPPDRRALYALRCSLLHDNSLANSRADPALCHLF